MAFPILQRLTSQVSKSPSFSLSARAILSHSTTSISSTAPSTRVSNQHYSTTSVYMNRSFPRSNSSVFLCGGNALQSEVVRLNEDMFLVDAGLGAPKICTKDELTGVPANKSITRFESKVGSPDLVAGKTLLQEQVLKRFFIDLVAGESLIKERATAKFNDMVGSTDGVAGEPLLVLPRRLRQNLVWMELNKILRTRKKVKGLLFRKIRGGFSVYIAGFVAFLPARFRLLRSSNNQYTIESINAKSNKMNIVLRHHRDR